ncbi:M16 family metallopeptidase [Pelobacter propionicus]|uniref:Peptidase M16 domain protein n=1 Tax=Pelobacter propionicus (strain DSM 2379 / NBRC 103807 / OttBd1) TaxID=338966 RepID=A1ATY8_PELPD|nr:pitrilysin family protein [Pelobacter propionicus]ABL00809.1 peptidase M16 domain protein [Pelobacter propionicus DSM 2379]
MRLLIALSTALCLFTGTLQAAPPAEPTKAASTAPRSPLEEKVVEHRLKNGMKLLMVERHTSPTVAAWIRFRVGSVDEKSDERGIAHLLEHMLFKGTTTLGTKDYAAEKPLLDRIEQTGQALIAEKAKQNKGDAKRIDQLTRQLAELEAEAGTYAIKDEFFELYSKNGGVGYNAFTSRDGTTYLISLPSNKLELWAAIESDRMQNAVLREFYTERAVVMEERRRSYDADPVSRLWETFLASSYLAHPYGQPTIGWMSDIENLTRGKAERFFRDYYGPQSAIVAIVGDIDPRATIALVERYFGAISPGSNPAPVTTQEPKQGGERRIELMADSQPTLMVGFHKPAIGAADDYVFDVIATILGHGRTSRLYRKLVIEDQLASDVAVFDAPGSRYPNLLVINADPRAPHTVNEVEQAILAELERLKNEPVSERELKRVLNGIEFEEARRMGTNGGLARNLTEFEALTGSWRYMSAYRHRVAAVTAADIRRVANHYFSRENRMVGFITTQGDVKK